jgi:hypothetical protein
MSAQGRSAGQCAALVVNTACCSSAVVLRDRLVQRRTGDETWRRESAARAGADSREELASRARVAAIAQLVTERFEASLVPLAAPLYEKTIASMCTAALRRREALPTVRSEAGHSLPRSLRRRQFLETP